MSTHYKAALIVQNVGILTARLQGTGGGILWSAGVVLVRKMG